MLRKLYSKGYIVKEVGDISVVTGIYWFTQDDFSRHRNG